MKSNKNIKHKHTHTSETLLDHESYYTVKANRIFRGPSEHRASPWPGPGWGPYGPLWAHMGPILFKKSYFFQEFWVIFWIFKLFLRFSNLCRKYLKQVRVGARSGLGPIWAHRALMGPYGPIRALMGPILLNKLLILIKSHKIINKDIEVVKLEILKVKTWFCDRDL